MNLLHHKYFLQIILYTRNMGKYCVTGNCTNNSSKIDKNKKIVSFHKFPRKETDKDRRNEWIRQVQRTREWNGPTSIHTYVCSDHFTPESFELRPELKQQMGLSSSLVRMLKADAVPTVFNLTSGKQTKRLCIALGKNKRKRTVTDSLQSSQISDATEAVPTLFNCPSGNQTKAKRRRKALKKTKKKKIVTESLNSSHTSNASDNNETGNDGVMDTKSSSKVTILNSSQTSDASDNKASNDRVMEPESSSSKVTVSCQTTAYIVAKKMIKRKGTQANIKIGKKKGTQTDKLEFKNMATQVGNGNINNLDDSMGNVFHSDVEKEDCSVYFPSVDSKNEAKDCNYVDFDIPHLQPAAESTSNNKDLLTEPKFIIFWSSLQMLLSWIHCPMCQSHNILTSRCSEGPTMGTLLTLQIYCESCGKTTFWKSQPFINDYPAGNVLLSSAILFSGSICTKVLALFNHMRLWTIEKTTFLRHQKELIYPAVRRVWDRNQEMIVSLLRARGDGVVMGGDGRADSMGHSAKHGTYTCMDLVRNCILDIRIVTSSEVKSSYHMELEGLKRSLDYIKDRLHVEKLVTDRHKEIAKFIQENHCEILHLYDIWHVAKSLGEKLEAASKLKACHNISPWIQSIVNHLYWSAVSSPPGQGQEIKEKWISIVNHVSNIHHHDNIIFPQCLHGVLEGQAAQKPWLQKGSKAAVQVEEICLNETFLSDVTKLSGEEHTWNLQAFHSLLNQFATKMSSFSPIGMECRVKIAALHYNENAGRVQHVTSDRGSAFHIKYPKYKTGGCIVQKVLQSKTFAYVDEVWEQVSTECSG